MSISCWYTWDKYSLVRVEIVVNRYNYTFRYICQLERRNKDFTSQDQLRQARSLDLVSETMVGVTVVGPTDDKIRVGRYFRDSLRTIRQNAGDVYLTHTALSHTNDALVEA